MEANLLDRMLETYLAERKSVTVTLQNKVRITGKVSAFDSYVLVIDGARRELVYRHAVAAVSVQDAAEAKEAKQASPQKAASPAEPRPKARPHDKPRPPQPRPDHSPAKEPGINSGMKDELLKWMQQKAAK